LDVPTVACDDVPITNLLGTVLAGDYDPSSGEIAVIGPFNIKPCCYCMELCHWYDIETTFDGGNVKVSTDGGATWQLVNPTGGYPGATNDWQDCIPDEPAYTGHNLAASGFVRDCFDLSNFAGMDVMVGFFFGSDSSVQYPGWYIKWVKFGSEQASSSEFQSWGTIKDTFRKHRRQ
jgi:hypothetical protein